MKASSSHGEKSKTKITQQETKLGGRLGWMVDADATAPFYSWRNRGGKIVRKLTLTEKPGRK